MSKKLLRILAFVLSIVFVVSSCDKNDDNDHNSSDGSYRENKEKGEKYLLNKKSEEGMKQSSTGLLFKIETLSSDTIIRPETNDSVIAHIRGERFDGVCFSDTTYKFLINEQIKGVQEGLSYMTPGSKFDLYIPYYLGFSSVSTKYYYNNKTITVLPYTALHYKVELKQVIKH